MQERRVGAYGICVSDGKILVIRKAKGPYKGTFDLPGGGIEFGESPAETVVREVMEETSLHVTVEALAGAFSGVFTFVSDSGERQVELHHLG
ncbi:MAG TPA: NUDIX domain-containing protein, partial [Symbiobacteriaceae bacterium]|nr:NUDIX domain-containing protein [Symbiobacteriaceae bacterium]